MSIVGMAKSLGKAGLSLATPGGVLRKAEVFGDSMQGVAIGLAGKLATGSVSAAAGIGKVAMAGGAKALTRGKAAYGTGVTAGRVWGALGIAAGGTAIAGFGLAAGWQGQEQISIAARAYYNRGTPGAQIQAMDIKSVRSGFAYTPNNYTLDAHRSRP